jgi:general secretion pathway protein G
MQQPTSHRPNGFTLVEMILVVSIIALLLDVAINKMGGALDFGKEMRAKAGIQTLSEELRIYKSQNGFYPTTGQGLRALVIRPLIPPLPRQWRCAFDDEQLPCDPWDNEFHYLCPGKHHPGGFDLFSCGADGLPNTDDDIGNWGD